MKPIILKATNRPQKTHGSDFGPRELTDQQKELCRSIGVAHEGVSHVRVEGELELIYVFS